VNSFAPSSSRRTIGAFGQLAAAQLALRDHSGRPDSGIVDRNAGKGDVLEERLERNCHMRNIAFAVGGK
jgi:hypothetical protein